ncbi:MAG: FlgD immunoglobulin-like domain containing protein [Bacteroidota bacterium]
MTITKQLVLSLLIWVMLSGVLSAQTIHRFQFKNGQYLTAKGGTLYVSEQQKGSEEITQWFIATLQDDFSFKLAPLSSPDSYLTSNNGNLTLSTSASTGTDWKALYAGGSFVSIAGTDANLMLADMGGQARLIEPATKLKSSEDPAGDHYRLTVLTGEPAITYGKVVENAEWNSRNNSAIDEVKTYPNPITDEANIVYRLSSAGEVMVTILDIKGQIINKLVDTTQDRGVYEIRWNRDDASGIAIPAGVYALTVTIGKSRYNQLLIVK